MRFLSGRQRWPLRIVLGASAFVVIVAIAVGVSRMYQDPAGSMGEGLSSCDDARVEPLPTAGETVSSPQTPHEATGVPVRLQIPTLDIDAAVVPIQLESNGHLTPPANVTEVGWWSGGAMPGSAHGTVVCTGHTVRAGGGVFDDLAKIRLGDQVRLRTAKGVIAYRVESIREVDKDDMSASAADLFGQDAAERLTLVTCSDYRFGSYHANTVVSAVPISDPST